MLCKRGEKQKKCIHIFFYVKLKLMHILMFPFSKLIYFLIFSFRH